MAAGAKWTMGFALTLNHSHFSVGLSRAVARIRDLRKQQHLSYRQAIEDEKNTRAAFAYTRATLVQSAAAAASMFTTLAVGRRVMLHLTKAASDFQYEGAALAAVLGLQTNAGTKLYQQFEKINPQIREFAPKEVLHRMKQLAQAGYSQNEIFRSMGAIFDTVTASFGELSTQQAVELGINLHRAFGTAHEDMRSLLDTAVTAANKFPMTTAEIASAMGYATEAAVEYNQSLEGVLTSIGMLMPVTKTASKAGTVYRNSLMSLTKPKAIEFLNKYGVSLKDNNGEMRDQLDIYGDLFDVLEKIGAKDKTRLKMLKETAMRELGGTRGGAMFAAYDRLATNSVGAAGTPWEGRLFEDRKTAVLAMKLGVLDSSDAAKKLANQLRETSQLIEQRFDASIEKATITLGQAFTPTVDRWRKLWTGVFEDFASGLGGSSKDQDKGIMTGWAANVGFFGMNIGSLLALVMGSLLASGVVGKLFRSSLGRRFTEHESYLNPMTMGRRGVSNLAYGQASGKFTWSQKAGMWDTLKMESWGTRITQVLGVTSSLITTFISLREIVKETAREMYDFGETVAEKQRKRQEKFVNAEEMLWKYMASPKGLDLKDMVKMKQGGFGPQFAYMMTQMQQGSSPLKAYDALVGQEQARMERQMGKEGWSEEAKEKRRAEFKEFSGQHRGTVMEHEADFTVKRFEKGDKTTREQIWAIFAGALAAPVRGDPEGFKKQYANLGTPDKPTAHGVASQWADAIQYRNQTGFGNPAVAARMSALMFSLSSGVSMDEIRDLAGNYLRGGTTPALEPYKSPDYVGSIPTEQNLLDDPKANLPAMKQALQEAAAEATRQAKADADIAKRAVEQLELLRQIAINTLQTGFPMSGSP